MSFNPRARDGREDSDPTLNPEIWVSIHAPVMDAKLIQHDLHNISIVSIHAPVMDAKACRNTLDITH